MIYSILQFIADKWWIFLLFSFYTINHAYFNRIDKADWFKFVFCFQGLEILKNRLKPREIKTKFDKIYNFFEYFNFSFWFLLILLIYIGFYLGIFGLFLKIIFKILEKGA